MPLTVHISAHLDFILTKLISSKSHLSDVRFEPTPPFEDQRAFPLKRLNHLESAFLSVKMLSLCSLDFSILYSMCIWE